MKTKTPRVNSVWKFEPNGYDLFDRVFDCKSGTKVQVIQPYGCPKNGTMGHVYVQDFETKGFLGLCDIRSLTK